jgi:antitoxin (DNA-binding transcriptional repressor) of toxin-antitoxin stability system
MTFISAQDVERDPHGFLQRVEAGETLVVTREQHPVAEIKPMPRTPRETRPIGLAAGEFVVPDDFDAPLPEDILRDFEGQ